MLIGYARVSTQDQTLNLQQDALKGATSIPLETAVKGNDTAAIQSNSATLGQIETERITAHANARAAFYALLSNDQKTKYSELEQEHMMGGGLRGGPPR